MSTEAKLSAHRIQTRRLSHSAKEDKMENSRLNLVAFGWALSGTLVILFVICEVAAVILPGWQLTHNWLMLFSGAEVGTLRNLIEGIAASIVFGWITAAFLVAIYNRLLRK